MMNHNVRLDPPEVNHMLSLLVDGREYYRTLAASPKCTDQNRTRYIMIETLCQKLERLHKLHASAPDR